MPGDLAALPSQNLTAAAVPVRLSPAEIRQRSAPLPDWKVEGDALVLRHRLSNFVEAIAFVNRLVQPAEQLGHHPEIEINYNHVTLRLTTHDAGGLTELDFQLASQISQLISKPEAMPEAND